MQLEGSRHRLSASDLVGHLNCSHLTNLDLAVARGVLSKPVLWDPSLDLMRERGERHEKAFVEHLRRLGCEIVSIAGHGVDEAALAATLSAMRNGAEIILQAALAVETWTGRADVLRRVPQTSRLGGWSYEVVDTKLARETKGGTVLQLCLYSDMLGKTQGAMPEFAYVVAPFRDFENEAFRLKDYGAYYRQVKRGLATAIASPAATYPLPVAHCDVCRWRQVCDEKRHADDHLSLVAQITGAQASELERRGIGSLTALGEEPLPLGWKPDRGSVNTYVRLREQARIQLDGRLAGQTIWSAMAIEPGFGLTRLPEPSQGDIFFDIEGDPFAGEGGLEYLFGYATEDPQGNHSYVAEWALTSTEEKAAFERFVDFVEQRRREYPDLHIYHYAPYEPAALKRLMGRYASREEEVDGLLRAQLFVDLYSIVRRAVRASVESYSIKKLEPLYAFGRQVNLADANRALFGVQAALELGDLDDISAEKRNVIEGYNRDDCFSVADLRRWLEDVRAESITNGIPIDRPSAISGAASENVTVWQARVNALVGRLLTGISLEHVERSHEDEARFLLAHILDWHRRENKAKHWEFFRLRDLSEEDLLEERAALAGLNFLGEVGGTLKAPIHRYSFATQDAELRDEKLFAVGGVPLGSLEAWDPEAQTIDIKKRGDTANLHATALYSHSVIKSTAQAESLMRIGEYVAARGLLGGGREKLARELLMRRPPDLGGGRLRLDGETPAESAVRVAPLLQGVLPIQGPPGSGKTYLGARMIVALVKAGKTVGITATSHKVMRNLLDEVILAAAEAGIDVNCLHKTREKIDPLPHLTFVNDDMALLTAIGRTAHVISGTSWFWSPQASAQAVDVLFVDEAAQMSLANVLAVCQAAKGLVLLGDPRQLQQPSQGAHPEGSDVSALDYVLAGEQTIPPDQGLFLDETWRLHPDICSFTSELFYDGRLQAKDANRQQRVKASGPLGGAGLRFVPVQHVGNQTSSPEEAQCVVDLVSDLIKDGVMWVNAKGDDLPLSLNDILIIAPYNAQVAEIERRLPGARIGTVDKFQGQEAAVVIYSMTTSAAADAPRGMEFLYSPNRLNVATSRAKCLCIIVANPQVFEPECKTPAQMHLANGYCRYLERAIRIER